MAEARLGSEFGLTGNINVRNMISETVNLFLRSRNAYRALRNDLILPCENTVRSFFRNFGTACSEQECIQVVRDVFWSLEHDWDKHVFVSADEIYVTPSIRFRASHVLGFAQNYDIASSRPGG